MRLLGDTRAARILSLELVAFVCALPIVIPGFAVWAVAHETRALVERRLRMGG